VSWIAWKAQPPAESDAPSEEEGQGEEAEVVNLSARRLREWLKGLVGMPPPRPPER
jgi:hypothetical protein